MFYDNYVKLCEGKGEKPTPVAQKLGCSSSNVALWKKGSVPRSATLNKIADYFGVTPQFLLFGETDDQGIKKDLPKEVSKAKQNLIDVVYQLSDEQCIKLQGIIDEALKLL